MVAKTFVSLRDGTIFMFIGPSFEETRTGWPLTPTTQDPPETSRTGRSTPACITDMFSPMKSVYVFSASCASAVAANARQPADPAENRNRTAIDFDREWILGDAFTDRGP